MRVFLFVLALALVSGAVAYIGDIVGRQVAKRRISVAGARPRKVGSIVAVITGIVIALTTFGLLILFSRDVRAWVVEYDKLKSDLAEMKMQYETTSQANETLKVGIARMQRQLDDKKKELEDLSGTLDSTKVKLDETTTGLAKSESELTSVNSKLGKNEQELQSTQKKLNEAGTKESKLRETLGFLEADNLTLRVNREALTSEIAKLEKDKNELEEKTQSLEAEYRTLESEVNSLSQKLGDLRTRNILIGANQPLAYIFIDYGWTGAQVREAIISTLATMRQKLAAKGYVMEVISQEDLDTLMSGLAGTKQDEVIIVSSAENVVPDSPIKLNYFVIDSRLCFRSDELIVEFHIPADSSYQEIEQMFAVAIKDMRAKADERNLLPDIDSGSVGSLNYDEVKRIITKIANANTAYAVQFRSGEDVYTMGNLTKVKVKYWPE